VGSFCVDGRGGAFLYNTSLLRTVVEGYLH
jgi:hypothetical protein